MQMDRVIKIDPLGEGGQGRKQRNIVFFFKTIFSETYIKMPEMFCDMRNV